MNAAAPSVVAALIPAAGSGTRLGAAIPKAFVELDGISLLTRSAIALSQCVDIIVVAVPAEYLELANAQLSVVDADVHVVVGGKERQDSVAAALRVLPVEAQYVLVHDAARALTPVETIESVISQLESGAKAVVPVLPVVDTIKSVNAAGHIVQTIDRATLRRVQTPQGFTREVLERAYSDPSFVATDDAGLVEHLGEPVVTVLGSELAFKITTESDLAQAQRLVEGA